VTYAMRLIPSDRIPPHQYRPLLKHRLFTGVVGVLFGLGISYVCIRPLL
jgi:hypothetical protein